MKKIIYCMLLSSALFSSVAMSSAQTLEDALSSTYEYNYNLRSAREKAKIADEQIMQALSRWLPSISLSRQESSTKQKGVQKTLDVDKSMNMAKVTQNIFRGGGDVAAVKVAKYSIELSRANLAQEEQKALNEGVKAYVDSVRDFEVYQIAVEREEHIRKYLNGVQGLFNSGVIGKADVARVKADLADAVAVRSKTHGDYLSSKAMFERITGMKPIGLSWPIRDPSLPTNQDDVTRIALEKNPMYLGMKNKYEASQSNVSASLSSVLPSVDFEYSVQESKGRKTNDPLSSLGDSNIRKNHSAVVSLTIPIFDGGRSWSKIRESKVEAKQTLYDLESTRETVVQNAVVALQGFNSSKSILYSRKEQKKASKVAYDGMLAEEKAGLKDISEVIEVRKNYFRSSEELVKSRAEYYSAMYQLKAHIGECTAKDLGLNVKIYDPVDNYNKIKWQLVGAYTGD